MTGRLVYHLQRQRGQGSSLLILNQDLGAHLLGSGNKVT